MRRNQLGEIATICLFTSISLAIIIAYRSPATGYELTIYDGTPTGYWVFLGIILMLGVILAVWDLQRRLALGALALAITSFILLPIIRGYYMLGQRDSLSHLGWLRHVLTDGTIPDGFLYPNYPIFGVIFARMTGFPENRVILLIATVLILPSLAFIPLLVREVDPERSTVVFGAIIAVGLLPLNPFNVFLWPLPSAQTIFFTTIPLYALLRIVRGKGRLAYSFLFGISFLSVLYFHPQQAINVLCITGAVTVGIFLSNRRSDLTEEYRAPLFGFAAVGVLLWMRLTAVPRFEGVFASTVGTILSDSSSGHRESGSIFESLDALGISFEVFALAILGKYLPLVVPAAIALYLAVRTRRHLELSLLALGGLFITPFVVYFLAAGNVNQWGRYIGFLALLFCIFGAVGLKSIHRRLSAQKGITVARVVVTIVLCTTLIASVPVMQPSPLTMKANEQVSHGMYSGYETALNHTDRTTPMYDTRSPPDRYIDALGEVNHESERYVAPNHFNDHNLPEHVDQDSYLAVNEGDIRQDVELYNGFRYSEEDFDYLSHDPNIYKVQDGDVELYRVESRENTTATD